MNPNLPPRLQSELTKERQAYHQEIEAQLARWRADLAILEADMAQANVSEQITLQRQITALNTKLAQAEQRLDDMKEVTGDAWAELQANVDEMHQDLADSMKQAQQTLHLSGTTTTRS